jgi:membrane dipeptidase
MSTAKSKTPRGSGGRRPVAARDIHARATVIDAEGVVLLLPTAAIPPAPINGNSYVARARAAGLTAMNLTMGIGGIGQGIDDLRALLSSIYIHLVYFDLHPDELIHIETVDDVRRAKQTGKLGIIFGVQGIASKIDNDLSLLRILQKLGLRVAQLTHNEHNVLGSGCLEPNDRGLTQLGRACVAEMNDVGIVVDVAHAGVRTALDAANRSAKPILISHANARALCDNPRNVPDEVLHALAKNGGVIGISAYSPFSETTPGVRPKLDDMIDHIVHVAETVGIDHVGLGTDFFEAESEVRFAINARRYPDMRRGYSHEDIYVEGFQRVDHFPALTARLVERGFSEKDIHKVLGGNLVRLFGACWA